MTKFIGWAFLLASPIVSGMLFYPLAALKYYHILSRENFGPWVIAYIVLWTLIFVLWFDGSKYQNLL